LTPTAASDAIRRLDLLGTWWQVIQPGERVRQNARRLLRVHNLRAADALQLAGALVAAEDQPVSLGLVSFDDRLVEAARREGFSIVAHH
jgi:predicted nucleic acid-binding protein